MIIIAGFNRISFTFTRLSVCILDLTSDLVVLLHRHRSAVLVAELLDEFKGNAEIKIYQDYYIFIVY